MNCTPTQDAYGGALSECLPYTGFDPVTLFVIGTLFVLLAVAIIAFLKSER